MRLYKNVSVSKGMNLDELTKAGDSGVDKEEKGSRMWVLKPTPLRDLSIRHGGEVKDGRETLGLQRTRTPLRTLFKGGEHWHLYTVLRRSQKQW